MTRADIYWLVIALVVCCGMISISLWNYTGEPKYPLELDDVIHVNKINSPENMPQRERLIAVMTSALNVLTQVGRAVDPTVEQVPQNEPYSTHELENRLANLTASILLLQANSDVDGERLQEMIVKTLEHKREAMVHQDDDRFAALIKACSDGLTNND